MKKNLKDTFENFEQGEQFTQPTPNSFGEQEQLVILRQIDEMVVIFRRTLRHGKPIREFGSFLASIDQARRYILENIFKVFTNDPMNETVLEYMMPEHDKEVRDFSKDELKAWYDKRSPFFYRQGSRGRRVLTEEELAQREKRKSH